MAPKYTLQSLQGPERDARLRGVFKATPRREQPEHFWQDVVRTAGVQGQWTWRRMERECGRRGLYWQPPEPVQQGAPRPRKATPQAAKPVPESRIQGLRHTQVFIDDPIPHDFFAGAKRPVRSVFKEETPPGMAYKTQTLTVPFFTEPATPPPTAPAPAQPRRWPLYVGAAAIAAAATLAWWFAQ